MSPLSQMMRFIPQHILWVLERWNETSITLHGGIRYAIPPYYKDFLSRTQVKLEFSELKTVLK